jgi:hypothetical protein
MFRKFVSVMIAIAIVGVVSPMEAAGVPRCDARANMLWTPAPGQVVVAEAVSDGPTCALAVVTLVLRGPSGQPLWVDSRVASQVMTFSGVKTLAAMNKALNEWIAQRGLARSDKLPDWPKGADKPNAGEFPFLPDADVDHEAYVKLRTAKAPMFCYVQGMESMACVALTTDGITKIGVQTFPG